MSDPRVLEPGRIRPLTEALANLPATYPEIRFQLMAISEEFRRQSAAALEPLVNGFIESKKPRTLDEHRQLARIVDRATCHLGLCVMANGEPGVPCAVTADPATGRRAEFAVLVRDDGGRRFIRQRLDAQRPWFTLAAAPPNIDAYLLPLREKVYPTGLKR